MVRQHPLFAFPVVALLLLLPSGCHIESHKTGEGKDNVDIGTPFGSMQVKTDDKATGVKTGLTPYPGATLVKKDGDDNGAADISMNFGEFKLGVHALDLRTSDPEDKVVAFYRNDMKRYGDVITCHGKTAVGNPVRTGEGLTCGSEQKRFDTSEKEHLELRAGSERHQHIVGVHTEDGATRIGLVALDLPAGLTHHDASDRE